MEEEQRLIEQTLGRECGHQTIRRVHDSGTQVVGYCCIYGLHWVTLVRSEPYTCPAIQHTSVRFYCIGTVVML